ncbi:MAG TPA: SLBB domain-containing protein [Chthonomonadales bacterium]|nr:SLBB domain-containing protein [Chthonomonadales bacterium]
MKAQFIPVILACAAMFAPAAYAEDKPDDYVMGPDDVIEITVPSHPGLDKTLTILPDGKITYIEIGEVRAAGKTTRQLAEEIKAALEKTRNNVQVSVSVKEVHSRKVRVAGAVRNPGAYDLKPSWRVLDLVAVAGGFTARPARITGRIIRTNGEVIKLDVAAAMANPDSPANPFLQREDLLLFEELDPALNKVYVIGQVAKPGAYDLGDEGISLLSLISLAGNPTEKAALTRAYVLRGRTEIPIDLRPALIEGKVDENIKAFQVIAGDTLFIPEIEAHITVMGQVNKPGAYPLPEKRELTAIDAMSLAGGQTANADVSKAGIVRTVDGKTQIINVNMDAITKKGDVKQNIVLQPNDILYIPAKGRQLNTYDIIGPFSLLSYLGVRLFR